MPDDSTLLLPYTNKPPDSLDIAQIILILQAMGNRITALEAAVATLTSTETPPPVVTDSPPPPSQQ